MPANVLVIDSSKAIQKVIEIALKKSSVKVTTSDIVDHAIPIMRKKDFVAVVTDAGFINSYQSYAPNFDADKTPTLIVLTGSSNQASEADLRVKGADHILKKPFDPQFLKDLIESLLSDDSSDQNVEPVSASTKVENQDQKEIDGDILAEIETLTESAKEDLPTTDFKSEAPQKTDASRKGKKAFLDEIADSVTEKLQEVKGKIITSPKQASGVDKVTKKTDVSRPSNASDSAVDIKGAVCGEENSEELERLVANQLPYMIQKEVAKYCDQHFDELARSVVETELRRLAMERARHLVDN